MYWIAFMPHLPRAQGSSGQRHDPHVHVPEVTDLRSGRPGAALHLEAGDVEVLDADDEEPERAAVAAAAARAGITSER